MKLCIITFTITVPKGSGLNDAIYEEAIEYLRPVIDIAETKFRQAVEEFPDELGEAFRGTTLEVDRP